MKIVKLGLMCSLVCSGAVLGVQANAAEPTAPSTPAATAPNATPPAATAPTVAPATPTASTPASPCPCAFDENVFRDELKKGGDNATAFCGSMDQEGMNGTLMMVADKSAVEAAANNPAGGNQPAGGEAVPPKGYAYLSGWMPADNMGMCFEGDMKNMNTKELLNNKNKQMTFITKPEFDACNAAIVDLGNKLRRSHDLLTPCSATFNQEPAKGAGQ